MGNLMKTAIFVILLFVFTNTLKIKNKVEKNMIKSTAKLKHIVEAPKIEGINKIIDEDHNISPPIVIHDEAKTEEIVEQPTPAKAVENLRQRVADKATEANHETQSTPVKAKAVENLRQRVADKATEANHITQSTPIRAKD